MDACALGGWTARGAAKVLQDRLSALPPDHRPSWMDGLNAQRMEEIITMVIVDAVEASQVVQEYMETEQGLKGRDFDEVYTEVKPYIDRVSRPLDEDMRSGLYGPGSQAMRRSRQEAEMEVRARTAVREEEPLVASSVICSRQGFAVPLSLPPLESDKLAGSDLLESLVLVGSCNGWDVHEARLSYCFLPDKGSTSGSQISALRLHVPEGGVEFQILSQEKEWNWILFPSQKPSLHLHERRASGAFLAVGDNADKKSRCRDFRIKAKRAGEEVVLKVSLSLEFGIRVWLDEVEAEKSL